MKKKLLHIFLFIMTLLSIIVPSELNGPRKVHAVNHTGGYVYFLKPSTWTEDAVMMFIGKDSYTSVYSMKKVENTDNLYRYTMPTWDGATYVAFANASSAWGSGNWGPSNRTNAPHYTNVYNNYGFNSGSYYVCVPASTANNAGITINYKSSASALNLTTRANVYAATETTYSSNAAAGTVSVSGYYMSAYDTASARSAVSSTATTAYASTTLAPGSTATFTATANEGYMFVGWSTSSSEANIVSTNPTYNFAYDISYTAKTVYALFKNNYTINLKENDDTEIQSIDAIYNEAYTLPTLEKTGYKFTGWSTTKNGDIVYKGGEEVKNLTEEGNGSYTLYAQWTINKYDVTLNVNPTDGGKTTGSGTYEYNSQVQISATAEIGYQFIQWNDGNTESSRTITLGANDVTYTASFEPKTYTINFDAGEGSITQDPYQITYGSSVGTLPSATPPSEEYVHLGWYLDPNADENANIKDNTELTAANFNIQDNNSNEVTLYAKYKQLQKFTVTFDSNGGSEVNSIQVFETLHYGFNATFPTPTRTGYKFNGWTYNGNLVSESDKLKVEGNHQLVASWTANEYIVTFDTDGGEVGEQSTTVTFDSSYGTLPTPTKAGYTFKGWFTATSGGTQITESTTVSTPNDHTLYAQWDVHTYTIVFDKNTGEGAMNNLAMTYDVEQTLTSNTFTKTGYYFQGWNTQADGSGKAYTDGQLVNNLTETNGDTVTLYAQWGPNNYTVVYNSNGGSGNMSSTSTTYSKTFNLTTNTFTKTGYTFSGWNTQADGKGTSYSNSQEVSNLTTVKDGTFNLYAQWTPISYSIAYDANGGEGTMPSLPATYDQEIKLSENIFTRVGYIFDGWNTKADGTGTKYLDGVNVENLTNTNDSTVTLYARWTPITYTIRLHSNTTEGTYHDVEATFDASTTLSYGSFTQEGYEIVGWAISHNGDPIYSDLLETNLSTTQGAMVELYAIWDIATYDIIYSSPEEFGVISHNNPTKYNISSATIHLQEPTLNKYTFAGWTSTELGISEPTKDVFILSGEHTGDITLVAHWDQKVTFYIDMGIIYNEFPMTTHSIDKPIIHLWQNDGKDYDNYGSLTMNRINNDTFIYYVDVYFTRANEPYKNHKGEIIDYIDMIMFGYDETKYATNPNEENQIGHKSTEKLYFPLSGDNNGEEYVFQIENNDVRWHEFEVGKTYHIYGADWVYEYDNKEHKWFKASYYESTEPSEDGTITLVFHLDWSGVGEVWLGGVKATATANKTYTSVIETDTNITGFEVNFEQDGSWWHIDEDGDGDTKTYDTKSKIAHNDISSISLIKAPRVNYYDGEELVYVAPFKESGYVKFIEKEGYKLDGWYYEDGTKFEKGATISESISVYANYVEANDYYIYVEAKNIGWDMNKVSVYKWSNYFSSHNNSWPGSTEDIVYLGNGMYRVFVDASKSFDHLIFTDNTTPNANGISADKVQTQNIEMTPTMSYYIITSELVTSESGENAGKKLNKVYSEISLENDIYVQKNTSNTTNNEFRFTSGLEDYDDLIEIPEGTVGKEFGYKFIFIKDDSCYVGYWNFTTNSMMDCVKVDSTLYEASTENYKGYYSLTLTDDITFKYSDYNQIIVVACYRDSSNNTQVIKAQEYNIIGTGSNVQLYKIER